MLVDFSALHLAHRKITLVRSLSAYFTMEQLTLKTNGLKQAGIYSLARSLLVSNSNYVGSPVGAGLIQTSECSCEVSWGRAGPCGISPATRPTWASSHSSWQGSSRGSRSSHGLLRLRLGDDTKPLLAHPIGQSKSRTSSHW